jgi:hypothetical protein
VLQATLDENTERLELADLLAEVAVSDEAGVRGFFLGIDGEFRRLAGLSLQRMEQTFDFAALRARAGITGSG